MTKTKGTFGLEGLKSDTPVWAKWVFRVVFILTTVATFIIAADPAIDANLKVRIGVYLKGLDMFIYGVSKLFGEKKYFYSDN